MKNLRFYTTAYSPAYAKYVRIIRVRHDTRGVPLLDCLLDNRPMIFRVYELTRYTI